MDKCNLLSEPWIPVRRASGKRECIAPWQLTEADAPLDIETPRPDFKGALLEFLVGLVQTALPPASKMLWRGQLPPGGTPSPETLATAFKPLEPHFNLFGERPRFLQDLTLTEDEAGEPSPAAALLMDTPGDNAARHNGDFFIKRDHPPDRLCPACAAAALIALQAYAPSGGVGYRTSLRGGGPLTTLIVGDSLWRTVWSNVLHLGARGVQPLPAAPQDAAAVFPWTAPTAVSNKAGTEIHSEGRHFLTHYWAMPRRIVLEPEDDAQSSACPVCGETSRVFVRRFRTKNYGNNYGTGWLHPLTPHRQQGPGKEPLTLKGVSEGRGYNHWLGLVYGDSSEEKFPVQPAQAVRIFRETQRGAMGGKAARLRAFGWDMENMKALNWCEEEYPVYDLPQDIPNAPAILAHRAGKLVRAADLARRNLLSAAKEALFSDGARNAKAEATLLSGLSMRFWTETKWDFEQRVQEIIASLRDEADPWNVYETWRQSLMASTIRLFEDTAERGNFPARRMQTIYSALNRMKAFNYTGCSKALGLAVDGKGGRQ